MKDILPKRDKNSRFGTIKANYRAVDAGQIEISNHVKRSHKGIPNNVKHYVVCTKCNNGWMSRLEKSTQPLLRKLIQGKSFTVEKKDLKKLSRWIALKTAVNECASEEGKSIPPSDCAIIKRNGRLPTHWQIWVACSDGVREPGSSYNLGSFFAGKGSDHQEYRLYASATTLILGHLIAYAIVSPGVIFQTTFASLGDLLQPVFPAAGRISWPSQKRVNHQILLQLTQAISIATDDVRIPWEVIQGG